ncbi:MAG: Hsp70 family protein, partial [Proteobacteria bacterium]|nr:Hsp70 family protein [Pseudomonadota bacterium]
MILGIDLGTTNSLASTIIDRKVEFVEFDGEKLLPSVVSTTDKNEPVVGRTAKNQYFLDPENSVKSIKRLMGSDTKTRLNGQEYLPEEISAMILRHIKTAAEKQFDRKFEESVITVPAYFSDDQRKATTLAGKIAGFKVKRIVNEPTAASLSYNFDNKSEIKAVVYDLGGGTFDVSVVNISENVVEVLASHGNNNLGGDDFDRDLADFIVQSIEEKYGQSLKDNLRVMRQMAVVAEKCKIELSDNPFHTVLENIVFDPEKSPLNIELEISRSKFEDIIQPYIEETMNLVHVTMSDAKLAISDINQILLIGGSSKIPLVSREFEAIFDIAPSGSIDPDQSVCIGAAVQGSIIEDETIDSILVDVTPYTFGTRVVNMDSMGFLADDDMFVPLIKRNSPLPVSKSDVFYKTHPEQTTIKISVYQGDSPVASENKLIGFFKIHDLSQKSDSEDIILSMNLDLNGILTVVATEKKTGLAKRITIDNSFDHEDIS